MGRNETTIFLQKRQKIPDTKVLIGYGPNDAQSLSDKIYFNQEHMFTAQCLEEEEVTT